MKQAWTLFALFLSLGLSAQTVATFENIEVDSFRNGSMADGGFESAGIFLPNTYDAEFDFWSGWAISSTTDTVTSGFTNQYSAIAGGGFEGSDNYAVAFGSSNVLFLTQTASLEGFYITNNTYAHNSMRDGDSFSKRFGGESGDDPDFLRLTIKKYLDGELSQDSVDFYLADYRFEDNSQDYIVDDWEWVDLSPLGEADSLQFTMASSDVGEFGINTPTYFCMDNFASQITTSTQNVSAFAVKLFPNPTTDAVFIERQAAENATIKLYDRSGQLLHQQISNALTAKVPMETLPAGYYILDIQTEEGRVTQPIVKQ